MRPSPEPDLGRRFHQSGTNRSSDGDRCVDRQDVTVWVDVSSLATGVVIESGGAVAEDASWQ